MNYFRSATYEPINLADRISLDANDTGTSNFGLGHSEQYKFTESKTAVDFYDLNKVVNNIHLDFDNSQPAQNLKVKISFTDGLIASCMKPIFQRRNIPLAFLK